MKEHLPSDKTFYAPAHRSSDLELLSQYQTFVANVRVEHVLDATAEILLVVNENRQIIFLNGYAVEAFGYPSRAEAIGCRLGEAFGCSRVDEAPGGCGTGRTCSQCGAAKVMVRSLKGAIAEEECRITRTGQREPLDLKVRSTPLDVEGHRFLVITVRDIADAQRRRALEHVFFHDVMNTAGSLHGYAELLQDADPGEVAGFQTVILQLSAQLLDEIQAQRMLLQAEQGELTVHAKPVPVEPFLRSVARQYQRLAELGGRSIRISAFDGPHVLTVDETLLRRVVGNMLKNAIEAARSGGTVTIGCDRRGSTARFWVHNAEVMPSYVQSQVFQRSFSTKGSGRGLGTYSMRLLVERYLGGTISFVSTPLEGTTFVAEIPA